MKTLYLIGGTMGVGKKVKKFSLVADEMSLSSRLKADIANGIRTVDIINRSVARIPLYQALDTVKIDTSDKTVREIVDEILLY